MKRFLCFLFGHTPEPGCTRRRSITFSCARCGALADVDLSMNR